jgi:hypothetical protein
VRDVRRLIENTVLTYGEIAARTGVGRASICRWTRDGGWKRPLFAPRATDTVPTERASARLKARTLAARLQALAERHVRELEEADRVDVEKLVAALDVLKMARLAAMGRRRRRRAPGELSTGADRRRPREHLPLDARRQLEAPAVRAARHRHGADRARERPAQGAHARRAAPGARRAPCAGA